jgi:putative ABC transport system permease protein
MTERRTKEIGIRKINGAKSIEIFSLLSREYLIWVMISIIIACPIAWYAMYKWLQNFAYGISIGWWTFALAGVVALLIALLTVSIQSYRAASKNPVEALRYE